MLACPRFSPSLMCADPIRMAEQLDVINRRATLCHIDIMDGHYVKNIALSPDFVARVKERLSIPIDVHLMVEDPDDYIGRLAAAGCGYISVHADVIERNAFRTLGRIKERGCQTGVALNPSESVESIRNYAHLIDKLTIMTVDVGFAGQPFISAMLGKFDQAAKLRNELGLDFLIEADGACNVQSFAGLKAAGCDVVVVGASGLFTLADDLDTAFDILERNWANA